MKKTSKTKRVLKWICISVTIVLVIAGLLLKYITQHPSFQTGTRDGLIYTYDYSKDYSFWLTGLDSDTIGDNSHIKIPARFRGFPVKEIHAFEGCDSIVSISIPKSVVSISGGAFSDCSKLESITISANNKVYHSDGNCIIETASKTLIAGYKTSVIPSDGSVTSIGDAAFYRCTSLTSITIPDSVTSIGSSAFNNCTSLVSITIPDSVTFIGDSAFYGCTSLTSITIPDSVTSIGSSAFYGCTSLTSVTVGNGATSIGERTFEDCPSLTNITIGNGVTSIGSYAFNNCTSLTSITIPNSVTSIGSYAFNNCTSLASITIPNSVTSISSETFYRCTSLESIYFNGTVEQWRSIKKYNTYKWIIYCTDGTITKDGTVTKY